MAHWILFKDPSCSQDQSHEDGNTNQALKFNCENIAYPECKGESQLGEKRLSAEVSKNQAALRPGSS